MQNGWDAALEIIKKAGAMARREFRRPRKIDPKAGGDIVTDIDLRVDAFIIDGLLKKYPDHGIISEESGAINSDREFVWVIDPIDGSKHYAQGSPHYAISLALKHREAIWMGIVYAPQTEECFVAQRRGGAFLNGQRFSCGKATSLNKALLCVEIPSRHAEQAALQTALNHLKNVINHCQRIRIIGVSSLGLCYCACGAFDGYINLGSFPNEIWDYAGGEMVLREAGGLLSRIDHITIAGNHAIHDSIKNLLFARTS
jgi:myo-inositol-1(or 4)-monophosphatase